MPQHWGQVPQMWAYGRLACNVHGARRQADAKAPGIVEKHPAGVIGGTLRPPVRGELRLDLGRWGSHIFREKSFALAPANTRFAFIQTASGCLCHGGILRRCVSVYG